MPERTIEDRLREEYFELYSDIRKAYEQLEAEIKFHCLAVLRRLAKYERLIVVSRIKSCDSAVNALRRRQEGDVFDSEAPDSYSLMDLPDLAGVRVLAFPRKRLREIDEILRERFPSWIPDPVTYGANTLLAYKYRGSFSMANLQIPCEYQIASILAGLFWEVEHSAIYKPAPILKGIGRSLPMQERTEEVYAALRAFESEFESQLTQGSEMESQ